MARSIHEIEVAGSEQANQIVSDWYAYQDDVKRSHVSVEGPHADLLTPEQIQRAAAEQKAQQVAQKAAEYRAEYEELTQERNEAVLSRKRSMHKELFEEQDTAALAAAFSADSDRLLEMVRTSAHTSSAPFGRAAFAIGVQRDLPEVTAAYLDANPGVREKYQDYTSAPSEATLERRLADAERIFSVPDTSEFANTTASVY